MNLPKKRTPEEIEKLRSDARNEEVKEFTSNFSMIGNKLISNFLKNGHELAFKLMIYLTKFDTNIYEEEIIASDKKDFFRKHMNDVGFKVDIKDFMEYVGIKSIKTLKSKLINMQNMQFVFDPTKDIPLDVTSVFGRLTIHKNDLYIKMPEVLFKEIGKTLGNLEEKGYTRVYYLNRLLKIKSVGSMRMFVLLHNLAGHNNGIRKQITMDLHQLNGYFGQDYERITDFYKFIVKPITNDLNPIFDFEIEEVQGEKIGRGRKPIVAYTIIYKSTKLKIDKPIKIIDMECDNKGDKQKK